MSSLQFEGQNFVDTKFDQAFGLHPLPKEGGLWPKVKTIGDNILRASHWVPILGSATSLISLAILAGRIHTDTISDRERNGQLMRIFLAFFLGSLFLMQQDMALYRLRTQENPRETITPPPLPKKTPTEEMRDKFYGYPTTDEPWKGHVVLDRKALGAPKKEESKIEIFDPWMKY